MAHPLSFFLCDALVNSWQKVDEATQVAATTCGWIVSTGTTNRSKFAAGTGATSERAATTFDAATYPNGTIDTTLHDCWRTTNPYTGKFASANWTVQGSVRAVTANGGTETGVLYVRLFRSPNTDSSSAVEITSAAQASATSGALQTASDVNVTITFNPGAFSVAGEYLFFQIAWGRVGAGGMTGSDVHFRTGSSASVGTRIDTSDFSLSINVFDSTAVTELVQLPFYIQGAGGTPVNDATAATDGLVLDLLLQPTQGDSTAITDALVMDLLLQLSVNDATAITEFQGFSLDIPTVSDSTAVTDAFVMDLLLMPIVGDDTAVTELSSVALIDQASNALTVNVGDETTITEDRTVLLPVLLPDTVFDATTVTDASPVYWSLTFEVNDATAVLDDVLFLFVNPLFIFDANDTTTVSEGLQMAIPDPPVLASAGSDTTVTDDLALMMPLNFSADETILVTDGYVMDIKLPPLEVAVFESLTATAGKLGSIDVID